MKTLLLYSGGMDSTLLLYRDRPDACLFFGYGQKHLKEFWFARKHCEKLGVPLHRIDLPNLQGSSLTGGDGSCVVPARNLIFAAMAANYAEANGFGQITLGCNADDQATFPDCRSIFWGGVSSVLFNARLKCRPLLPLLGITKGQIMGQLSDLGVRLDETWSCYEGGDEPCGECAACLARTPAPQNNETGY